ncbi:MAG: hypothetical protein MUO42_10215 [Anaerolineaceae bacterium]|nr:hypothetical protein [Anaerolineaceae bacterium]
MANKKKSTLPARRTGGQPGNWNGFKHGFYSKRYYPLELKDLSIILGDGLFDEISLLRVIMRRVFNLANDEDAQTLDTWTRSLNTLGAAATRLAGLLRTQLIISGEDSDTLVSVLSNAIGAVSHDLGTIDPRTNRNSTN